MLKMKCGTGVLCAFVMLLLVMASGCVSGSPEQSGGGGGAGGGQGAQGGGAPGGKSGPVRIGFSMDTLKEERWQRDKELVERRAKEVGATVQVEVANGDDPRQISQVDNMLTRGVDVLIVAPHNGEAARTIVEKAHAQGVPVISYDRLIMNADVDLYVSHQVKRIGELQGEYAVQHAPKGNYVLIFGSQTDNNALLLRDGQMTAIQPKVDSGDIKIVTQQHAREWLASEALRITEDALTKTGNDIQAIVASNDGTAGGAISALPPQLVGKVIVTGQDAQLDAAQRIAEGKQTMTIYKPIKPLADSAVDAAIKLARKEPVDAPDRIDNKKIQVPSILQVPIAVDKNNLADTIVKDGYHKLEDVYKNVPRDQWPNATAQQEPPTGGKRSGLVFAALLPLVFVAGLVLMRRSAK